MPLRNVRVDYGIRKLMDEFEEKQRLRRILCGHKVFHSEPLTTYHRTVTSAWDSANNKQYELRTLQCSRCLSIIRDFDEETNTLKPSAEFDYVWNWPSFADRFNQILKFPEGVEI